MLVEMRVLFYSDQAACDDMATMLMLDEDDKTTFHAAEFADDTHEVWLRTTAENAGKYQEFVGRNIASVLSYKRSVV